MIDYSKIPVKEWAKLLDIKWSYDLDKLVFNPYREEKFNEENANFIIGIVKMDELFNSINKSHQLKGNDIWKYRDKDKINRVIDFWKKGGKMTPPLIDTLYNFLKSSKLPLISFKNEIALRAGFHRFSVCCLIKLQELPVVMPYASKKDVEEILKTIRWV
jgi:hypothetical protein